LIPLSKHYSPFQLLRRSSTWGSSHLREKKAAVRPPQFHVVPYFKEKKFYVVLIVSNGTADP
jgi:hypothetical protein